MKAYFPSICAVAILITGTVPNVARAECDEDALAQKEILVVGTLQSRSLDKLQSPALGIGIDQEQIDAVNAVNTEDIVRYAPNIIVRKRYAGDANATLSIRNMHTQQTPRALVTVDGFVISNFLGADFDTAPKWAVVARGDVERAEVIYGPTSARYSGNSLGGTLRLNSRAITENAIRASVQGLYQNYRYYRTDEDLFGWAADATVDFALKDRGGVSIGYNHFENEGQPMEWRTVSAASPYAGQALRDNQLTFLNIGAQDSTVRSREDHFRLRGQYDLDGNWKLRTLAALLFDHEDTSRPKSYLVDGTGKQTFVGVSGVRQGLSQKAELLVGLGLNGEISGWALDLSISRFDVLSDKGRSSDSFDLATGMAPLTGFQANNSAYWKSLESKAERKLGRHALAFGLSYAGYQDANKTYLTSDWRSATRTSLRDSSGGETRLLGLFAEDAVTLSPLLTATFGLRYERWRASCGYLFDAGTRVDYRSRKDDAFSPKLAVSLRPDDATELLASVAYAKRFATVRELYQPGLIAYGADIGQIDLNGFNPELKAERGLDFQLTASRRFGNVKLTLSGWRQEVKNAIFTEAIAIPSPADPDVLTTRSLMTNINKVRGHGVDLILAAEDIIIPDMSLDANISWNRTTIVRNDLAPAYEGNLWPRVPKWRINASLRYKAGEFWLLAASFRHQSTPDRDIANSMTSKCDTFYCVSPFSFIDLKVTRTFGRLSLSLGVDNLFGENAFVYHPYPGRSFLVELRWNGVL